MSSYNIIGRKQLSAILRNIKPRNIQIYQEAFVHKSALKRINEKDCFRNFQSNERLEFLGDVVLSLAVTDYLYSKYPKENEGFLTKLRIKIVKGSTLTEFARYLDMEKHILTSSNTRVNKNILENAFEALIGAIYLDYREIGLEMQASKKFITHLLDNCLDWSEMLIDDNYKDILMRFAQKIRLPLPKYEMVESKDSLYSVRLHMMDSENNSFTVVKEGVSKKEAEQECAREMLKKMKCLNIHFINSKDI
jgi:ribonuclease III